MFDVEVRQTRNKGRGVFAKRAFKAGEVIEICPVILFSEKESELIDKTPITDFWFYWSDEPQHGGAGALPAGYGFLYNHSRANSAIAERDYANKQLVFRAVRDIAEGEEITIRYNMVWFDEKE